MELGASSVSLVVKDLAASRTFYERLGFGGMGGRSGPGLADPRALDAAGVALTTRANPDSAGPAHIVLSDPDGNVIMLDQHV